MLKHIEEIHTKFGWGRFESRKISYIIYLNHIPHLYGKSLSKYTILLHIYILFTLSIFHNHFYTIILKSNTCTHVHS